VAAPSANRFGRISPTTAQHVLDDLGREAPLILDGGRCAVGLESTIVDLSRDRPALLRPGGIEASRIEAALAEPLTSGGGQAPRVSGSLAAHYAPGRPLELLDARALPARALALELEGLRVAVWSRRPPDRSVWMWRSMPEDPVACGQALFECLRELDRSGADCLLIEQPPSDPRWLAVNDRLGRAAVGAAQLREPEPGPATG
jgi:L-threonylcarbamoyladenylate synthase